VAVVVVGSIFLLGSGTVEASDSAGDTPWVVVVFVTASLAAGVERLLKNRNAKNEQ
jgi:hypothetical protein